jgi:hypothetical protein
MSAFDPKRTSVEPNLAVTLRNPQPRALPRNHCNGLRSPIIVGINSDTVG